MTATDSPGLVPRVPHRRTVRIIEKKGPSRAAVISLIATGASAVVLLVAWRTWRPEPTITPVQRTLSDVELTWRCESGHTFKAYGQLNPIACLTCRQTSYPLAIYECRTHGDIEVVVQLRQVNHGGSTSPSFYRFWGHTEWIRAGDELKCPKCEAQLSRKQVDPLAHDDPRKRTGGP